ncbi:MAG: hypothetical protein ABI954_15630 [Pyrinomonadaceae bacterium]
MEATTDKLIPKTTPTVSFRQNNVREAFRLLGAPGRFVRANLLFIWLVILFAVWSLSLIRGMPYPSEVWRAFQEMYASNESNNLVITTYTTLKLNVLGLFWATLVSLVFSYISVVPFLYPLNKFLQWLRYIPIIAFNLIFLSFFAIGANLKIAMLAVGMSFFLITGMTAEIAAIPRLKFELARVLNYNDWRTFYTVVFRPTLPKMIDIVAQNAAIGWTMIVAIENFDRTEGGIGAQMFFLANQPAKVYVYLIIIGIIAVAEDQLFVWLKRLLFPYTQISERA